VAELNGQVANMEQLKDTLLNILVRRSGARRASLLTRVSEEEGEHLVLERAFGLPSEFAPGLRVSIEGSLSGRPVLTGRPLLVRDVGEEPHRELANRGSYLTASCISLPLSAEGEVFAVVNLADREDGSPFGPDDLRPLEVLAEHAGQVLVNSHQLERMTRLSILDDLTGLYNRRFFRRSLDREFRRAERYERPLALAILDLDHFKVLNDENGHETGNRVLAMLGEILRTSFRNTDIVARYGGEEFAVIFPEIEKGGRPGKANAPPVGALAVLERLRARVAETDFPGAPSLPGGRLTISGGVADYPSDAKSVDELLDAADTALYAAKRRGRNRISLP
jgi:diguanylate cyclase (GGDEF)-like protein